MIVSMLILATSFLRSLKELRARVPKVFIKSDFYEVYTDGTYKLGRGAWAYVILKNQKLISEKAMRVKKSSSNRMEFQAAIEALKVLPLNSSIHIYSDSRILVDTMTLWVFEWKRAGWKKARGGGIPNVDLIQTLDGLVQTRRVSWSWIKAHSGIEFNERCDKLCIQARSF